MRPHKPKAKLIGIGILGKLAVLQYSSEGIGVDVRAVKEEDRNVDLAEGIELTPELTLRLATKEDTDSLRTFPTSIGSIIQYSLHGYVLECSLDVDDNSKALGEASGKIRRIISSTVTAFRLLKPGYIDANVILWITARGSERSISLMAERTVHPQLFDSYRLRTDELSEFANLVKKVSSIDFSRSRSLRIALDRFDRSYYEIEDEDKLIDYVISFEALFLEGKDRFQHAIIPIACSMLLGKTQKERREIKDLVNLAYEIRNGIVHGSDYERTLHKRHLELEDLVKRIEDVVRASLRRLI